MQYWQRLKNSRKNSEKMRNLKKVMNNCTLIISIEDGTLRERFIGGKPYRVDMSLAIYEGGANE